VIAPRAPPEGWPRSDTPVNATAADRDVGGVISDVIGPVAPGAPVVHVAGFVALMLVVFTGSWAASLVTIAHEGGHVVVSLLSGRNVDGFHVNEGPGGGGGTDFRGGWGVRGLFTNLLVVGYGVLIGWVAVSGSPDLQATVAVVIVWWMLLGVFRSLVAQGLGRPTSDAAALSDDTWIPAIVWVALFWFVAIVCLWVGGRRLLGL
jgi:hypothetical protein